MKQTSCVAHAARGITQANRVGFARNGQIVDRDALDVSMQIYEIINLMNEEILKIRDRLEVLENER